MAWDADIASLLRQDLPGTREKRMFGGLAFLLGPHLVACATGTGALFRPGAAVAEALALPGVGPMRMGARVMRGWVMADAAACTDDALRARLLAL